MPRGPGVEVLGEGMVDLLATNLQGVGGITAVEPRPGAASGGAGAPGPSRRRRRRRSTLGRELDAGSVVIGSAVSTGGRVRLAADLYAVAGGERLGRAQVDGPADSVLPLVDRLSVALLRDVWRSREPLPSLDIASLTTDSIAALRAYLQGERYYRRLALDSALAAYTRAVEVDSTFALAHLAARSSTAGPAATAARHRAGGGGRLPLRRPSAAPEPAAAGGLHAFEKGPAVRWTRCGRTSRISPTISKGGTPTARRCIICGSGRRAPTPSWPRSTG